MALTTIAELRTALGVGTLYADATLQEVCDAADNVLLPFLWKNQQSIIAHSSDGTTGTLYFDVPIDKVFYVNQTVTISGAGSRFNGYQPSPYRMGNTLLARVRGLLAPYLDPRSMVG
jgi:hypothetical protein